METRATGASAYATGLAVADAVRQVMAGVDPLPAVRVPLEQALGRVLGESVRSSVALPPWDNASMDGYAVRSADVAGAERGRPVVLRVTATVAAGQLHAIAVGAGEAVRIMTGAPVPDGADAVVRVEDTDGGTERVHVHDARDVRPPARNIRPRGEDVQPGDVALDAGQVVGPAQLGVLASVGASEPFVHRAPRVAILATGDELVPVQDFAEVVAGRRIVSSNSYTLAALVKDAGAEPVPFGIAPDDPDAMREHLQRIRGSDCDVLLTTGGVSVGAFDYTRSSLEALGAEIRLWRVRMRPGAPIGFGHLDGRPWLGLPGNPVSAMVTFELFARPLLRRLAGHRRPFRAPLSVRLAEPVALAAPLTHFLRATLAPGADGVLEARLTGAQGSGLLTSMARADALLVIPPEPLEWPAGARVQALPFAPEHGWSETSTP